MFCLLLCAVEIYVFCLLLCAVEIYDCVLSASVCSRDHDCVFCLRLCAVEIMIVFCLLL